MLQQNPDKKPSRMRNLLPTLSETTAGSILVVSDTLALLLTGLVTYFVIVRYSAASDLYTTAVTFLWLSTIILMHFGGLYRYEVAARPMRYIPAILVAVATACLFLLAAAFSIKVSSTFSRLWFGVFAVSSVATISSFRIGLAHVFRGALEHSGLKRSIAIVGTGTQSDRLLAMLNQVQHRPIEIHDVFSPDSNGTASNDDQRPNMDDLIKQTRTGLIDDIIIALPWQEDERIMSIVSKLRDLPVNVYLGSDLIGFRTQFQTAPSHFGSLPIFQVIGKPMSGWDYVIKTLEDYVLGILILVAVSPLMILIALAVWFDSGRPILFRQKRLGFNNEVFDVFKFRTMRTEAQPSTSTVQATEDDPRITGLGRFLRRWSLDELPQLFNVLNGTMSLVGPRPHALDHNDEFSKRTQNYFARHRVKPGMTGLAQVKGFRGPTDTNEKLEGRIRNDIFYAENWSPSLDAQILARTIIVCLFGKNAY